MSEDTEYCAINITIVIYDTLQKERAFLYPIWLWYASRHLISPPRQASTAARWDITVHRPVWVLANTLRRALHALHGLPAFYFHNDSHVESEGGQWVPPGVTIPGKITDISVNQNYLMVSTKLKLHRYHTITDNLDIGSNLS